MLGINAIKITPEILLQVAEIDEFKGLWLGLDRHTTGLQLLGDVADYGAKFKSVLGPLQEHPISPEMITILHDNKYSEHKGYKTDVHPLEILQGAEVAGQLDTAPPEQVGALLGKLCEWVNDVLKAGEMHPLIIAAVFTAVFLQIAPFDKGNKEIAQFLIVLIMLKKGYDYAPYTSLAPLMSERGSAFYGALSHNQTSLESGRADWGKWLLFFLDVLRAQTKVLHTRLYDQQPDLKGLSKLSVQIMDLFKTHKRLSMKEIIKLTNGRRATIKLRLNELINGGYLVRHGAGRSTWYALD